MNNVNGRKLFRKKAARNKLNQMGGIMSSDAELMQTVAKYNVGGPVSPSMGLKSAVPADMTAAQYRMASPTVQQQLLDAENRYRTINRASSAALNVPKGIVDLATNAGAGIANLVTSGAQGLGLVDPTQDYSVSGTNLVGSNIEQGLSFPEVNNPEEYAALLATSRGEFQDPAIQRAVTQQKADQEAQAQSQQLGQEVFGEGYGMASEAQPFIMPGVTPSTMPKKKMTAEEAAATEAAATEAQGAVTTPEIEAAKKGELGPEKQVKAVVAAGTKEEQQEQLKSLMAQFTQNVPEYEGMDKGMAIAKIGFAMAAGKSSNALTNVASALEQGADMFIKDKEKRDAFNRQVQLSALQYGLGEQSKDRAAERALKTKTSDYVLMPGETYTYPDGRTITGGENGTTISLNAADILENGLPDGVQGTTIATAIIERKSAYDKAVAKAAAEAKAKLTLTDPKKITDFVDKYSDASRKAIEANNAMHLTKQVMVQNADGKITGFRPGFNSALAKAMELAGVDATSYTDRDLAIADLRKVFQKLVPLTLGKDQSANSISNQDVNRLADAYMSAGVLDGGIMSLMTTPANVLNSKLSGILVEFQNSQDEALNLLTSLEQTGNEFLTPSGAALGSRVEAQRGRLQEVFPKKGSRPMLSVRENGTFYLPN